MRPDEKTWWHLPLLVLKLLKKFAFEIDLA
jgi:hypothetical protein